MRPWCVVVAALSLLCGAPQADWPRWMGPLGNGHVPANVPVPKTLPAEPRVLWTAPLGYGNGSPAVSAQKVFVLDNRDGKEVAAAFGLADGREIWRVPLDDLWADSGSPAGPRGTPTVDGDRVYVQSCRGELRCLRTADGGQLWRVSFVRDFGAAELQEAGDIPGARRHGNTASPLVDGGRLYVMVGGSPNASVVCFNKLTGAVIWKSQDDIPGHAGPIWATLGGLRQLVCFMAEAVIGLDPSDGKLLWRAPVKTQLGRHVATPVIVGDTVVVGSYTSGLIGIRVTRQGDAFRAEEVWRDRSLGVNFSSPVAIGGFVYGLGPGNRLFCVEARTGKRVWVEESFFSGTLDAGFASFLVMGQNLLVLAERGRLSLVAPTAAGCKVLGQMTVCERNWCSPAYVGGKLIVRDNGSLRCLQLAP
ncbi:MAG: PQQ-binding-like beta-propeller repeat protein [Chthonomonadales bacterium]|nr:PQQ-binding-like beta-propeller repeat protein [Chthonomonadales bacterium]